MPRFDIVKECSPDNTFRVQSVVDAFTMNVSHITEHFEGNIDIEGRPWNVGLIVGGSGTGKSTIARDVFRDAVWGVGDYVAKSVIDDMPQGIPLKDIEQMFTSVGFASPPSWLKPYGVLSNGEKMRCDLARALLQAGDKIVVFDEFTSVVNRDVAKTASFAVQKAVRRKGARFVAVSCHDDVIEWLMPDWVYNTDEKRFFGVAVGIDRKSSLTSMKSAERIKKMLGKSFASITI